MVYNVEKLVHIGRGKRESFNLREELAKLSQWPKGWNALLYLQCVQHCLGRKGRAKEQHIVMQKPNWGSEGHFLATVIVWRVVSNEGDGIQCQLFLQGLRVNVLGYPVMLERAVKACIDSVRSERSYVFQQDSVPFWVDAWHMASELTRSESTGLVRIGRSQQKVQSMPS